ncbi:MAG: hypothetical protein ABL998_01380 [Planctomycetota bacterium]
MADNDDTLNAIETAAEQLMTFVVSLTRTAAWLIFLPFRATTKLFREDGRISSGYVQPVAYAVLATFLYYCFARLVVRNAFLTVLFSSERLKALYAEAPHEISIGTMLLAVGPMMVFIDLGARLVGKVGCSRPGQRAHVHRLVLFSSATQLLLAVAATILWGVTGILRIFTYDGTEIPLWSQILFYGLNGSVAAYVLCAPGVMLVLDLRRRKTSEAPRPLRLALAALLASVLVGPGALAAGAATTALEFELSEKHEVRISARSRLGSAKVEKGIVDVVVFPAYVSVFNDTASLLWLVKPSLQAGIALGEDQPDSSTTLEYLNEDVWTDGWVRVLQPGESVLLSVDVKSPSKNIGYVQGEIRSFDVTFNLLLSGLELVHSEPVRFQSW